MVMEASGNSERKYCHCSGGGQRLMRTSLRLMERSTDRFTTTGTNSELPCCEGWGCTWVLPPWPDPGILGGPRDRHYHLLIPDIPNSGMLPGSTEVASEPTSHYRKRSSLSHCCI